MGKKKYNAVVYVYIQIDTNQHYVGATTNEKKRRYTWHSPKSPYGGRKIREARKTYGLDRWMYYILEQLSADTKEELEKVMKEAEKYWIREFKAVSNGWNVNFGGYGMGGLHLSDTHKQKISLGNSRPITIQLSDGSQKNYSSHKDAAEDLRVSNPSISYYQKSGKINKKNGWKIEKI